MKLHSLLSGELLGKTSTAYKENITKTNGLFQFIFHEKTNRKYLTIGIAGSILQLVIFKLLYPFPDFISDSYSYIATNLYHMDVNLWPVGYSKFLLLIHVINQSDLFLILIQYFIVQTSILYFFFSILYIYKLSLWKKRILFVFLLFNPIFLYISNCVLSDALFFSLSLLWITQTMWMLYSPKKYHLITIPLLIGALFTIRYTAVFYPLVNAFSFAIGRQKALVKLLGILSPLILMVPFVVFTESKTKEITGTSEFSVFGGWQIANNALYMYDHIHVDTSTLPKNTIELDGLVKQYFRRVPAEFRDFSDFPGTWFIKHSDAPLKRYMRSKYNEDGVVGQFWSWGQVSPIYNLYGTFLIKNYPFSFLKYYLCLNVKNYFLPHLEKFDNYNLKMDSVFYMAQYWFNYPTPYVRSASKEAQGYIFGMYPILFLMLNFLFMGSLIILFISGKLGVLKFRQNPALFVVILFLITNFAFSVFATPVVLRYQIFPAVLLLAFSLISIDYLEGLDRAQKLYNVNLAKEIKS